MAFSDYTTPDSVRALLGVSDQEVTDEQISNDVRFLPILEALDKISDELSTVTVPVDIAQAYRTLQDSDTVMSREQNRFCLQIQNFCSYVVAIDIIPIMPILAPKVITDGKLSLERVLNPFENMLGPLTATMGFIRARIITTYASINSAVLVPNVKNRTQVLGVGIAVDPVTG